MNGLRELQEGFARSLNFDVDAGYAENISANGLSGSRRLGIYHNGVAVGFRDALSGVYEVVVKLVGEEFFAQLASDYCHHHPSQTGNIHDFGEGFSRFIADYPGLESLPYLPDVARLEWLYHTVFHSPTSDVLNIEKLSQVPESKYEQLSLLFSQNCHLFYSDYPVLKIWQCNQQEYRGDENISLEEGGVHLAIAREGKHIAFHSLEPSAFALLDAVSRGVKFNQACDLALQLNPQCDIGSVLQEAVMNRMIIGFSINE